MPWRYLCQDVSGKYLCQDVSGILFRSHRIMILQTVIFISLSVLFYVDKTLRDGEPRVWKELNAAWDAKFSCLPGGRPEWDGQRYGSILFGGELGDGTQMLTVQSMADPPQTVRTHIWPGMSFDFAISGESELLEIGRASCRERVCLYV